MIVGVTGLFCAGKDTFAAMLEKRSFAHISLSDMIRDEILRRGQEITHERTVAVGNELRRRFGPNVLAEMALRRLEPTMNTVVTSIRNPGEVAALRRAPDFAMVFIDAAPQARFERSARRGRAGDFRDWGAFEAAEREQMASDDPAAQQLAACRDLADLRLSNDSTLEEFEAKTVEALQRIQRDFMPPRPSWDAYFMAIAEVTVTRSNCVKRRVGAVIVKNKQIVSTGYNGTPKGIANCDEGGCPRCWSFGPSGEGVGECLCVHAEENAIVQAACNGISIDGGTLYATLCPCSYCAKSIINAGIKRVVYQGSYAMDETTRQLFAEAGIESMRFEKPRARGLELIGLEDS
ncbi:MAG: hypothetical protein BWZ10_02150 [candidate division BRC1 bacterium ADurb.BinA364]|nr:MAG: hypothetical protein BWZ10_02150 [candidate division BRC1 bacterium ADurb.BinA364]